MDYSKMGAARPHKGVPRHTEKGKDRAVGQKGRPTKADLLARMKKAAARKEG